MITSPGLWVTSTWLSRIHLHLHFQINQQPIPNTVFQCKLGFPWLLLNWLFPFKLTNNQLWQSYKKNRIPIQYGHRQGNPHSFSHPTIPLTHATNLHQLDGTQYKCHRYTDPNEITNKTIQILFIYFYFFPCHELKPYLDFEVKDFTLIRSIPKEGLTLSSKCRIRYLLILQYLVEVRALTKINLSPCFANC